MINIGLLGLGVVGTGVVEILEERQREISLLVGEEINIKKVLVKNVNKKRDVSLKQNTIVSNFEEILNDDEITIVIEVTSDIDKSYEYIKAALNKGKSVVTANKALVSKYFEELSSLADEKGVSFLYEASVGGGIPIIKPLKEEIILNEITDVQGILNGTCNYILTRMFNEGLDYSEVLTNAQELGYAEMNPAADVEGDDTLRKLRILGSLSLQGKVGEEDIILEGINKITSFDVRQIKLMQSTVKLIGEVMELDDGYNALVLPTIVKNNSYFASVNMAYNAVIFKGDNIGELKFYGSGAGKLPTGDAVLRDVLDIALGYNRKANPLGDKTLKNNNSEFKSKFYLRISDSTEKIVKSLEDISEKVLSTKENIAILTREIELKKIMDTISSLGIEKDEYFIARILD
ncbi:homoserine dehydrogenase [Tissierella creatinophila]|uniref:Homoserine dehydrogenase n=1 Tax=Tissierella creatinophila DSM 6911 TaxID=1123403 RepID=A0A1U7M301_TISCR|nr:homoserine dehydrogenase [Tissierella creatinophila]OLS01655.1 homoserine dehydrogenase [Tissierella creatinophila DSM 6911]